MKNPFRAVPDHPLWLALIPTGYLLSFAYGNWLNSTHCISASAFDYLRKAFGLANTIEYIDYWEARTLCIDPYWVNQWLKNYSAGLVKRGFLGTSLEILSPGAINMVVLNIACVLIPIAILVLMAMVIRRQTRRPWPLIAAFIAIIALSPFGKVLGETTGDPLQVVCLVTFIGLTILTGQSYRLDERITSCALAAIYLINILIYEGSFLLLLPMLAISRGRIARLISLAGIGLGAALIWQFSGAESPEMGHLISSSYSGYNPITGYSIQYIHHQSLAASASFFFNVKQEFSKYIEDPYGSIRWIGTAAVMSCFFMLSFANVFFNPQTQSHYRFIKNWLAISLCGLPFFLITHDWFRYGIITIILSIAMLIPLKAKHPPDREKHGLSNTQIPELIVLFSIILIAAVIGPHQLDVRRGILPIIYWQAYGGMAAVAALALWRLLRTEATASRRVPYSLTD